MPLDEDQKSFIEKKVEKLGSVQAVREFYKFYGDKKCLVDRYALKVAKKLFPDDEKPVKLKVRRKK